MTNHPKSPEPGIETHISQPDCPYPLERVHLGVHPARLITQRRGIETDQIQPSTLLKVAVYDLEAHLHAHDAVYAPAALPSPLVSHFAQLFGPITLPGDASARHPFKLPGRLAPQDKVLGVQRAIL